MENSNFREQFIPYDEALVLKELGFDEPCLAWTLPNEPEYVVSFCDRYKERKDKMLQVPLWQQAFSWFATNHELFGSVLRMYGGYRFYVEDKNVNYMGNVQRELTLKTENEANLLCLQLLIGVTKVKNELIKK